MDPLQQAWQNLQQAKAEYENAEEDEAQKRAAYNAIREQIEQLRVQLEQAANELFAATGVANAKHQSLLAAQAIYDQALGHAVAPTLIPEPVVPMGSLGTRSRKKNAAGKKRRR